MIKSVAIGLVVIFLSGCAVNYTYEGKAYPTKEEFFEAIDASIANSLSGIEPLPEPLTDKSLIFALPSEEIFVAETFKSTATLQGSQPTGLQKEVLENLIHANYRNTLVFLRAIEKRNIYASTSFVEMQSVSGSLEASDNTDVLYYVEPTLGSGQYFYSSFEHGKQVFAYDRSSPTSEGKVRAFIDAVQLLAVRD